MQFLALFRACFLFSIFSIYSAFVQCASDVHKLILSPIKSSNYFLDGKSALEKAQALKLYAGFGASDVLQDLSMEIASWRSNDFLVKKFIKKAFKGTLLLHDILFQKDSHGNTLLHVASSCAKKSLIRKLVAAGADVNACNNKKETPLHVLSRSSFYNDHRDNERKMLNSAFLLCQLGTDVNAQDRYGNAVLHNAVRQNAQSIIALILSFGAKLNVRNNEGKTPLFCLKNLSCDDDATNTINTAKLLLDNGAQPEIQDNRGNTILHEIITRAKEDGDICNYTEMFSTIINHCKCIDVQSLLKTKNLDGKTVLHEAVCSISGLSANTLNCNGIIKIICSHDCNKGTIGFQDNDGRTVFHYLALGFEKSRDVYVFNKVLNNIYSINKIDVCKTDKYGKLALDYMFETVDLISIENENLQATVQELVKYRMSHAPLQTSGVGRNILHVMAETMCAGQPRHDIHEYHAIYELMFNVLVATYEPSFNAQDDKRNAPLHSSITANNLFMVNQLLNKRASTHYLQDSLGQTPLHLAIRLDNASIANEIICKCGTNKLKDCYGRTVVHYAAKFAGNEIFNEVAQYADKELINAKDHRGRTALDYANKQWQFRRASMLKARAK